MRIYLDVSCLNRPCDDQEQPRIRLEAEAVTLILERCTLGLWEQVSSEVAQIEIDAIKNAERRNRVRLFLPEEEAILKLAQRSLTRGVELQSFGFKPADALHIAAAEEIGAAVLLSCDDRMCRLARRHRVRLKVRVANPLDWLEEISRASNT